jgi:hypothetical protein
MGKKVKILTTCLKNLPICTLQAENSVYILCKKLKILINKKPKELKANCRYKLWKLIYRYR